MRKEQRKNYGKRVLGMTMMPTMLTIGNPNAQTINRNTQNQIWNTIWQNPAQVLNTQNPQQQPNSNSNVSQQNLNYDPVYCEQIWDAMSVNDLQNQRYELEYASDKWLNKLWSNEKVFLRSQYWIKNDKDLKAITKQIKYYDKTHYRQSRPIWTKAKNAINEFNPFVAKSNSDKLKNKYSDLNKDFKAIDSVAQKQLVKNYKNISSNRNSIQKQDPRKVWLKKYGITNRKQLTDAISAMNFQILYS